MNNSTQTINEQILLLREEELTMREIADELSVTYDKVRYVCRKENVGTIERERVCLNCDKEFKTIRNTAKFCSDKCRGRYNKANGGTLNKECETCGDEFRTYYKKKVYCSDECRNESYEYKEPVYVYNYEPVPKIKRKCRMCDETFETTEGRDAIYCSKICSSRSSNRKISNELKKQNLSKVQTCEQCSNDFRSEVIKKYCSGNCAQRKETAVKELRRRKAISLNGKVDKDITLDKLILKEDNICYLCNKECNKEDFTIKQGHYVVGPSHPSIDHVHPISKGGTHTWDNVRLAHHLCNSIKSNKT
jgi:hypothetical protein